MSMLRPGPTQQNAARVLLESVQATMTKFFQGGYFNFQYGLARGQLTRSGQATVASATTSVTVTHGAGFTPTLQQIHITLGNNPTNAIGVPWVDTITSTTFKINCANPGAGGALFGWMLVPI